MTEEKRLSERKESMVVIEFRKAGTADEYYAGITRNYSDDGFSFESETLNCRSGAMLEFKLKHPDRDEIIKCLGGVIWTRQQKYGLIAGVKLHSVPTEKQNILAEIMSPFHSHLTDSAIRKELKPAQLPSPAQSPPAEDRDVQNERYSDIITESIVSAVRKNNAEETGSTEEEDIVEAVPPEVRTEKYSSAPKVKNRQGKLSPVLITVLIVSALAVLVGYLINNSSTEKIDSDAGFNQAVDLIADTEKIDPDPGFNQAVDLVADTEKIDPDQGFNQEVDIISDEDIPSESLNKGLETGETVAGERFIVHVAAWKTKVYAMSIKKKVMNFYPDSIMIFENNYYIIMVPNIASREEAVSIAKELADRFNVSPLIYVQQRNIPEIKTLS
ncbi:MAG TPA: PilZ domain-containing protein [Nitrospirae bacterium]|nr:PilZ domain-containing protein [Nitrospirota bacterium]